MAATMSMLTPIPPTVYDPNDPSAAYLPQTPRQQTPATTRQPIVYSAPYSYFPYPYAHAGSQPSPYVHASLHYPGEDVGHQLERIIDNHWSAALLKTEDDEHWDPLDALESPPYDPLSLSPQSIGSYGSSAPQLSPSLSPLDLRVPRELPKITRTEPESDVAQPLYATRDYDHPSLTSSSPPQPVSPSTSKPAEKAEQDPEAAAFLRERLGEAKWATFSARLFERRLTSSRARRTDGSVDDEGAGAASVYHFLLKVEAVKEVLRTLVPNPYNPEKVACHPWPRCAKGHVRLTRDTVLSLAGWSNTQFSYWMRRVEAVAVFAPHDATLAQIKDTLFRLLYDDGTRSGHGAAPPAPPGVTGKGLDALVETVKRRTGLAPYVRGKHASLDPFCAAERGPAAAPPAVFPTFHAQMYSHEERVAEQARRKRKRAEADAHAGQRAAAANAANAVDAAAGAPAQNMAGPQQVLPPHHSELNMAFLHPYMHCTGGARSDPYPLSHAREPVQKRTRMTLA